MYNKFVVQMHFLYNVLSQIHYTSKSPVRHFLSKKVVKWCIDYDSNDKKYNTQKEYDEMFKKKLKEAHEKNWHKKY